MRQFFPECIDAIEPLDVYRDLPVVEGRPAVRLNMIGSVDGATALDGRSGGLGGPADRKVFAALRSLADVVLVAAGTVRAENYGPARLPIAVVSGSLRLDWDTPFFTDAIERPIVVTSGRAPADAVKQAEAVADVLVAGDSVVDLADVVTQLGERGFAHVLAEGGPTFNGALAAAGLLDELCLTFAPRLVAGDAKRIIAGPALQPPPELLLRSLCEEDGYLFFRYRCGTTVVAANQG
ncbi:MAG TPA: pyrimidine reductase family protein [Acidimicrobiia bacterium]|nr:pyrimidine reductase family protein [Acidimicrobiia bacterium]